MLKNIPIIPIVDPNCANRLTTAEFRRRHRAAAVVVMLEGLPPSLLRDSSARLTKLYNACGCKAGAAAFVIATAASALYWIFAWRSFSWLSLGGTFAAIILLTGAAKAMAILIARRQLKTEVARLVAAAI